MEVLWHEPIRDIKIILSNLISLGIVGILKVVTRILTFLYTYMNGYLQYEGGSVEDQD